METVYLEALSNFIILVQDAKPCWYSLKKVSDQCPTCYDALGMSYDQMMEFFKCCGVATKRWDDVGWEFYPTKFLTFRERNHLESLTNVKSSKLLVFDDSFCTSMRKKRGNCFISFN